MKKIFSYKTEEAQNPYIGISSFQHFRGESLYSDMVVDIDGDLTETEHVECYPVPDYVPENGREEGYYPDTSIVYIRILWKEFEPAFGVYNYAFIEDIIKKAESHHQTLIFRLMAHSTRAMDDVPDWLRKMIPCPERPEGKREKASPTDPKFLEYFTRAIRAFADRFDACDTLDMIDISLPGAWGEGYALEKYPQEDLEKLVDTYIECFKHTQLMAQIFRPDLLIRLNKRTSVGWRGDGLGSPKHIADIYPPAIEKVPDLWKKAPVSFESYWWLCEWKRQGWDIDQIIKKTLEWHISSFNPKSLPIPWEWKDKIDGWIQKMGYHYGPKTISFPNACSLGETLEVDIVMENYGVAPIYKDIPFMVRLRKNNKIYATKADTDVRTWLPGEIHFSVQLPAVSEAGTYILEIGFDKDKYPTIYLCTDAERNGKYYKVGEVTIQ
ncbi:MAG: DUF4832 domain-containing protein [Clostridia bacterium]|nr:DUF4832 domain-containing protein [Clostridia bacterium]